MNVALRRSSFSALAATLTVACIVAHADEPKAWTDPADARAEIMPLAAQSLLLGVVRSGEHCVAVGSRGQILQSGDGRDWKQVEVPTRLTFTAVAAVDAQIWAVGHEGIIVHSTDGGEHWQVQRQAAAGSDDDNDEALDPRAPLLSVLFLNATRGYAVGAYSLALRTDDGGATWQSMNVAGGAAATADKAGEDAPKSTVKGKDHKLTFSQSELKIGEETTPHLNAIVRTGSGALLIVGERGSAFRSRDDGATWQRRQLPYDGSMFGAIAYAGDHVIAFGLRGHVYETSDLGEHWNALETGTELSLMGGAALPAGGAVIVGANGTILIRGKAGESFDGRVDQPAGVIAAVLPLDSGTLLLAGENGLRTFTLQ
jgi:photosystem II stability/assembly factor-like uncharacterized protein